MGEAGGRKSIFITGGAAGIGAETARLFASRGWFCGLTDINEPGLADMQAELGAENCYIAKLDVTNRQDWASAIDGFSEATEERMHVLFNNAGIANHGWLEEIDPDAVDRMIDINVKGVINGVRASLPILKQTPGARIVNVASVAGLAGVPQLAPYCASKFAVRGLTEALDIELGAHDVRATCLMPWFMDTDILNTLKPDGDNRPGKQRLTDNGVEVYPVSLAAERAWDAAHGKDIFYPAGKKAKRVRFAARFMPGRVRKNMKDMMPKRKP